MILSSLNLISTLLRPLGGPLVGGSSTGGGSEGLLTESGEQLLAESGEDLTTET